MSNFIFTHWLENWHRLVPVFFMGKTPTAGSGKNSCFHHKLKGRKRPNKEDIKEETVLNDTDFIVLHKQFRNISNGISESLNVLALYLNPHKQLL